MDNEEKKETNLEELDAVSKLIKTDIEQKSGVMFYVGFTGEVIMLTTGEVSKKQQKIAERMLVSADNHSIILRLVISLEILFEKIIYKIKFWNRK